MSVSTKQIRKNRDKALGILKELTGLIQEAESLDCEEAGVASRSASLYAFASRVKYMAGELGRLETCLTTDFIEATQRSAVNGNPTVVAIPPDHDTMHHWCFYVAKQFLKWFRYHAFQHIESFRQGMTIGPLFTESAWQDLPLQVMSLDDDMIQGLATNLKGDVARAWLDDTPDYRSLRDAINAEALRTIDYMESQAEAGSPPAYMTAMNDVIESREQRDRVARQSVMTKRADLLAGQAYLAANPEALAMQRHLEAREEFAKRYPDEYQRILREVENDPEMIRLNAELRDRIERGKSESREYFAKYHLTSPETLEDWLHLAEIVGIPTDGENQRGLTARLIARKATAYVEQLRLHRAVMQETVSVSARELDMPKSTAAVVTDPKAIEAPDELDTAKLAKRFQLETKSFSDAQWRDRFKRQYKGRAEQGMGKDYRSFFIDGVGGIYYGRNRTFVFRANKTGAFYSLAATHSNRIGKLFAVEFALRKGKGKGN